MASPRPYTLQHCGIILTGNSALACVVSRPYHKHQLQHGRHNTYETCPHLFTLTHSLTHSFTHSPIPPLPLGPHAEGPEHSSQVYAAENDSSYQRVPGEIPGCAERHRTCRRTCENHNQAFFRYLLSEFPLYLLTHLPSPPPSLPPHLSFFAFPLPSATGSL